MKKVENLIKKDLRGYHQDNIAPKSFTCLSDGIFRHYELSRDCFGLVMVGEIKEADDRDNSWGFMVYQINEDDGFYGLSKHPIYLNAYWLPSILDCTKRMIEWRDKYVKEKVLPAADTKSDTVKYSLTYLDLPELKKSGELLFEDSGPKSKVMIIVDYQYDFTNPAGSLYVNGSELIESTIEKYISSHFGPSDTIVFTQDYHPKNHCSFIGNFTREICEDRKLKDTVPGKWPSHCVKDTVGVEISKLLLEAAKNTGAKIVIARKGLTPYTEEYGAFDSYRYSKNVEDNYECILWNDVLNIKEGGKLVESVDFLDKETYICGVAGDYCVLETLKILNHRLTIDEGMSIYVYMPGIVSIGDGKELVDFINSNERVISINK